MDANGGSNAQVVAIEDLNLGSMLPACWSSAVGGPVAVLIGPAGKYWAQVERISLSDKRKEPGLLFVRYPTLYRQRTG